MGAPQPERSVPVPADAAGAPLDGSWLERLRALRERTKERELSYEEEQAHYRRLAFIWRLAAVFAFLATVLLGLKSLPEPELVKDIALVSSALVTLCAAVESYRDDRANYIRMAATFKAFRRLRFEIDDLLASGRAASGEVERLSVGFQVVQRTHDSDWEEGRRKQLEKKARSDHG